MAKKERCERPGCRAKVKFQIPGKWCNKHWMQWWRYGLLGKKEPNWMKWPKKGPGTLRKYRIVETTLNGEEAFKIEVT